MHLNPYARKCSLTSLLICYEQNKTKKEIVWQYGLSYVMVIDLFIHSLIFYPFTHFVFSVQNRKVRAYPNVHKCSLTSLLIYYVQNKKG